MTSSSAAINPSIRAAADMYLYHNTWNCDDIKILKALFIFMRKRHYYAPVAYMFGCWQLGQTIHITPTWSIKWKYWKCNWDREQSGTAAVWLGVTSGGPQPGLLGDFPYPSLLAMQLNLCTKSLLLFKDTLAYNLFLVGVDNNPACSLQCLFARI